MAPGFHPTKLAMTPFRVMAAVAAVAAVCLVISALSTSGPNPKLGVIFPEVPHVKHRSERKSGMADGDFWRTVNLQSDEIPKELSSIIPTVTVGSDYVNIMGTNTFYREAIPPATAKATGEVVVLLHGAAFTSLTWLELNTIHTLAAMGHRVIAVDLPGFGETKSSLGSTDRAEYILALLKQLKADQPIMVSPSMSGGFSIPFILKYPKNLGGYVPVAPGRTEDIVSTAADLTIPTLIIYGQKDHNLGIKSRDHLLNIPTSQYVEIPKASHPAYLDNPQLFHKLLYNFIKTVHSRKATA